MDDSLNLILNTLHLTPLDEHRFEGHNLEFGFKRIYGGQILAQALRAAYHTLPPGRYAHSLHAYFLQMGDVDSPLVFQVHPLRDGQSISVREVWGIQHNKRIFTMMASFHTPTPGGVEHQINHPLPAFPEDQPTEIRDYSPLLHGKTSSAVKNLCTESPFFHKSQDLGTGTSGEWLRTRQPLPAHLPLDMQQCLIAYLSDMGVLWPAIAYHDLSYTTPGMQMASLDHALWFVHPGDLSKWCLFRHQTPYGHGGRIHGMSELFNEQGQLMAYVVQEGLLRIHTKTYGPA